MAVRTANVWLEEFEGLLLQQREKRRLKTNLETFTEIQIVEEFFIDFTVPFPCVAPSGH